MEYENTSMESTTLNRTLNERNLEVTDHLKFYGVIYASIDLCLVPFILCGNCLVLFAIGHYQKLQTITNVFVASLAVADLLVGLLTVPFYAVFYMQVHGAYENKFMCLARYAFVIESCGSSLFNLAAVAADRYIAILHPLRYTAIVTQKRAKCALAVLWTYMTILSMLPTLGWNTWTVEAECDFYRVLPKSYTIIAAFVTVFVGLSITTVLYFFIFREVHKQIKKHSIQKCISQNAKRCQRRFERDVRSAVVMGLVSLLFVLFWIPYLIVGPLKYSSLNKERMEIIKNFTLCFSISNSLINPMIYGCLRKDFREAFRKLLHCPTPPRPTEIHAISLSHTKSNG